MAKYKYSKYNSDWFLSGTRYDLVQKWTIPIGEGSGYNYRVINNDKTLGSSDIAFGNTQNNNLYIFNIPSYIYQDIQDWNNDNDSYIGYKLNGIFYMVEAVYKKSQVTRGAGSFIEEVIAEDGTFPNDGLHSDGFYYIKGALATIPINILVNGTFVDSEKAYVNVGGVWKEALEFYQLQNGQWVKLI